MRLSRYESQVIKKLVEKYIINAEIYLFGSRVNDNRKGGDIDILIISENKTPLRILRKINIELEEKLGEQKIDIVSFSKHKLSPFAKLALLEGIKL